MGVLADSFETSDEVSILLVPKAAVGDEDSKDSERTEDENADDS